MGFIDVSYDAIGSEFFVEVIGEPVAARVVERDLYDPTYALVRG